MEQSSRSTPPGDIDAGTVPAEFTELKVAQEALRSTAERLNLALIAGRLGDWTWDAATDVSTLSERAAELFGIPPGPRMTWTQLQELLHPDDRERARERVVTALAQRSQYETEYRIRRADGSQVWVLAAGLGNYSASGEAVGMTGVIQDITARKRAEQDALFLADAGVTLAALLDYESTLQKVARLAVPHFADWCTVDMLDEGGALRRLAVAHVDPSKVELARELHRRFPPDPSDTQGLWNILRTGNSEIVGEITDDMLVASVKEPELLGILRSLGLRSYIGVALSVRGKVIGAITFIAAESGRRYDAADLTVAEDLARRAAVAVENGRLYQTVREADRRKEMFFAVLAHELRNPLAPIRNALEIFKLAVGNGDRRVKQAREMAERQLHSLTRMVDDILDVSRMMRNKIELRRERANLSEVVHRAVETARPVIDAGGHDLQHDLPDDPIWVEVDVVRIAQVVSNLLHNAAKYTDRGGQICVRASVERGRAVVRVKDTGVGITPEKLRSIFDLFMQVDGAGYRSQGGLGIGLTVVKNLVIMHGGTVQAFSEGPNRGSEFVVSLPLFDNQLAIEAASAASTDADAVNRTRRILVTDDNVDAAESLAMLLSLRGHAVQVAYDGATALQLAEAEPPEMVFLDIGMPKMDGYEVARRFRASPPLSRVLLIALTGWGGEEDRRRTREAGFDHHLIKPLEPEALEKLLKH